MRSKTKPDQNWRKILRREQLRFKDSVFRHFLQLLLRGKKLKGDYSIHEEIKELSISSPPWGLILICNFFMNCLFQRLDLDLPSIIYVLSVVVLVSLIPISYGLRLTASPPASLEILRAIKQASDERRAISADDPLAEAFNSMLSRVEALKALLITDEQLRASLDSEYCLESVAARYALISKGGSAIHALKDRLKIPAWRDSDIEKNKRLKRTMQAIGQETRTLLAHRAPGLLCPHCLTRYRHNILRLSDLSRVKYIGCRTCGDSLDYLECREVVAILDAAAGPETFRSGESLAINWLTHRILFDFDRVEIRNASDAEIERFAVLVGNDTDPFRQKAYRRMECRVGCPVSENTGRVLASVFGKVIRGDSERRIYQTKAAEEKRLRLWRGR